MSRFDTATSIRVVVKLEVMERRGGSANGYYAHS